LLQLVQQLTLSPQELMQQALSAQHLCHHQEIQLTH
jgi:hypothetical protein